MTGQNNTCNLTSWTSSLVNLHENSRATVNGSGNKINLDGWDARVTTYGNSAWLANGATGSFYGNDNAITAAGYTAINVTGQNNTCNLASWTGSLVNLHENSRATVNGYGNKINVDGWDTWVTTSSSNVWLTSGATGSFYGNDNLISAAGYTALNMSGWNNTCNLVSNSGSAVYLAANSSVKMNGTGNTLCVNGAGTSVDTYGNAIYVGNGLAIDVSGGNDAIYLGTGNTLSLHGGSDYNISAQYSTVNTWDNTSFTLSGANSSLTLGNHSAVAIKGSGNQVRAGDHSVIVDNGVNNQIWASNSVIKIGSENINQTIVIRGNGNYIDASALQTSNLFDQAKIVIWGTGNTIYGNNNTWIDLTDTRGNFVTGKSVPVGANSNTSFTRGNGQSPSGTYGPANPYISSGTQINFPGYNPGGTSEGTAGVKWGDPEIKMPWYYDLPSDCPPSYYNDDGTLNVVVCGAALMSSSGATASTEPMARSSVTTVENLITAMASYGADNSATSNIVASAQNDPQMMLAASSH